MQITSKKYTKLGRARFGSAIFIDDLEEKRVDTIVGILRDRNILISFLILFCIKLLSANFLGLLTTVPIYLLMYYMGSKTLTLHYTEHRILIEEEYSRPRLIRGLSSVLFAICIIIPLRWIIPDMDSFNLRIVGIGYLFQFLRLYDNRFFFYRRFVIDNFDIFNPFDSVITVAISLWFAVQFRGMAFDFTEINLDHISEQLVKLTSINSIQEILSLMLFFTISQFLYFNRFSILFLLVVIVLFQLIPRQELIELSLIGPSNRSLLKNYVLPKAQFSNLSRITAATFGWKPQREVFSNFPYNIVPKEVSSVYETGLRAYSHQAFRQSNILGLIISSIANIFVIAALIRFAIIFDVEDVSIIYLLAISMVIISTGIFIVITGLNEIRKLSQKDEKLLIGRKFIGRYTGNSLWILSGKSSEGTTVQRGNSSRLIRFDKAKGLIIAWERFTLLIVFGIITIIIAIWASLGAINLEAIPLLFPSLFDLGLEFLEQKATAELEFFIIAGYVLWILAVIFYPRYYARTRPSLFIDMEYASIEPIVLKDFEEHQKASMEFTKSLIASSEKKRRSYDQRPGAFILALMASGQIGEGKSLKFYLGEDHRIAELALPLEGDEIVERNLIVSGLRGYAELPVVIELYNQSDDCIYTLSHTFQLLYTKQETANLEFGIFGELKLTATIKKQKS